MVLTTSAKIFFNSLNINVTIYKFTLQNLEEYEKKKEQI